MSFEQNRILVRLLRNAEIFLNEHVAKKHGVIISGLNKVKDDPTLLGEDSWNFTLLIGGIAYFPKLK